MLGHSHLVMGVASWTAVGTLSGFPIDLPTACMAAIGGLFPDIDHPRSTINRQFKPFRLVAKMVPHRGPTHSILFIAGLAALLLWADLHGSSRFTPWMLAFWTGCLSHLFTDWMTRGGIPLFWPFPFRCKMPGAFLTGSWQEKMVVSVSAFAMLVFFAGIHEHAWVANASDWCASQIHQLLSLAHLG